MRLTTTRIAQITGPDSLNHTDRNWNVYGTDLGHTFEHKGTVYMIFGDTFGPRGRHHRCNALAWLDAESEPERGLRIAGMRANWRGRASEILPASRWKGEVTVIPTNGISVAGRMWLHYMSVRKWGAPGRWKLNHSGLAYSGDDGRTWTRDGANVWSGDSNFGQGCFARDGGYVYLFGIPGGRFGGVKLARASEGEFGREWRYWTGEGWSLGESEAAQIVPPTVGELSVIHHSYYDRWLTMYLNESSRAIVLRESQEVTGPWSAESVVASADDYPQLYAPYMTPCWNDGPAIYFTMSMFGPYNVFLMRTTIDT